jgi:hypothetical protein
MRLASLMATLLISGCYSSYSITDHSVPTPSECGNDVVEGDEQCDGNVGSCVGDSECPGFRMCRDDCTWTDCVDAGFGILAGPTPVTGEGEVWSEVRRANPTWTGSRYGVFFSGDAGAGSSPVPEAFFTLLNLDAEVELTRRFPGLEGPPREIHGTWVGGDDHFAVTTANDMPFPGGGFDILDASGSPTFPGLPIEDDLFVSHVFTAANPQVYVGVWARGLTAIQLAWIDPVTLGGGGLEPTWGSPFAYHSLPEVINDGSEFVVFWHVDDTGGTNASFLQMQRFVHDETSGNLELVTDPMILFGDWLVRPPYSVTLVTPGVFAVVFSVQPYFDAPFLELYLSMVDEEGVEILAPRQVGTVQRARDTDVGISWSGAELAIASASPVGEDADVPRNIVFDRFTTDGGRLGTTLNVTTSGDSSMPALVFDGEAYGLTWVHDDGVGHEGLDLMFARVGCIPPD